MATKKLKTIDIKGKEYVEVNERIKYFRENYPTGQIITEMLSDFDGVCVFKATVSVDGVVRATGHAYEKENSSFINKTSYIENCETSAVGRALGMFGIGVDTSIASAEEVLNAINNQNKEVKKGKKALESQIKMIRELVPDEKKILDYFKVKKLEDLTVEQASEIIKKKKGNN